ncbi:glycyl-radical enzyme activating protein [Solidesulfovibrio sp.]|uniref:glycyl-radical enzyme activating protein n=1 Tax=Solidesulfovibrio sp. TaxID=2910990 RepID=UPI00262DFF5E|nr:glycyl-radical enzyme activating protein [Solidesulfovibrio sp.]
MTASQAESATTGRVFDIQRYCVHDGPGVRSTVFLKGCPLSCAWCSNPESQDPRPQILYFRDLCRQCGACLEACPEGALALEKDALVVRQDLCRACGTCVAACLYEARIRSGEVMTVDAVCRIVQEDWRIYAQSGGGITVGGGEALAQPEFLGALLYVLHDGLGYHTCLDTSGFAPWATLEALLPHLDLILLDIKQVDAAAHRKATGVDNAVILDNAARLSARGFPTIIRVPLVPGVNDDAQSLEGLGTFLRGLRFPLVEIMPYHAYGRSKYAALGRDYPLGDLAGSDATLAAELLQGYGLEVAVHQR